MLIIFWWDAMVASMNHGIVERHGTSKQIFRSPNSIECLLIMQSRFTISMVERRTIFHWAVLPEQLQQAAYQMNSGLSHMVVTDLKHKWILKIQISSIRKASMEF